MRQTPISRRVQKSGKKKWKANDAIGYARRYQSMSFAKRGYT